jgi:hypothetical protein
LHITDELFRELAIIQGKGQVTRCTASESGRARRRADGVTPRRPERCCMRRWLEETVGV